MSRRKYKLMESNIIGRYLSEEPLHDLHDTSQDDTTLRRFVHSEEEIHHPQLIGRGIHGVAVLASIKDVEYALKVFKEWKQPGPVYYEYDKAIITSPLACESRAFARLASMNENGTWAIKCYGWMRLSDEQFKTIKSVVRDKNLSRWVIVKAYEQTPPQPSHMEEIKRNFAIAQRARILPDDARLGNYKGSKIVDLSCALTYPCPGWTNYLFKSFYEHTVPSVSRWWSNPRPCEETGHAMSN